MVENNWLIPNHQFRFAHKYYIIQQTHRFVRKINETLEKKQYCSAAFFDISQAFDKVWHTGLLYKLRLYLRLNYFPILKSYLHSRHFLVKVENDHRELSSVNLLYNADLPTSSESTTTFADGTAVLATDSDPAIASQKLQTKLAAIQKWF
jgi:hypothetical protein